ncbi:MAG: DNA polymerase/3'-5' exonuclease PolX [Desulfobacterales bacterium]|jgi:DNA polymerase (family 10)
MPVYNADIANVFDEIADYLEIDGENPFRVRAYRNAARTVRGLGPELKDMVAQKEDLSQLPGIGKELTAKIHEILDTGTARALKKLQAKIPPEVRQILKLPNLGPKRVRVLYHDLKIQSLDELRQAAKDGRIRELPGFGKKTENQLLAAVEAHAERELRFKIADVRPFAESLLSALKKVEGVKQVVVAGSYRRSVETVGDLDILVIADKDSLVMDRFVAYQDVADVLSKGMTRSSVVLRTGLQVDLRRVEEKSFGAALQYFTGSQAHNIAVRRLGRQRGLKINEYGVFKFDERVAGDSEESVYNSVGLSYIPPELRENRGEIDASREKRLPRLVKLDDIKGDLHVHTNASDGRHSLKDMALAAKQRRLQYIAVAEHSQLLAFAGGLDESRLLKQMDEIDRLSEELEGVHILKSIEVDILEDGRLDLQNDVLEKLDLVVASVHSNFDLPEDRQTARILRAMDNPYFTILAHPSGRLIDQREAYKVDMEKVIRQAAERGCFIELNARPKRLDLVDIYCQVAKDLGVLISINSDAHRVDDFDHLRYGVGQARRGWLGKGDVLNTRSLAELRKLLKQTMG